MMKPRALVFRIGLAAALFFAASAAFGAQDTAYYREAIGKSRYELKTALHNIIKDHTALRYKDLWKAFETTDQRPDNDTLAWDIYSNCDFPFYAHYGPNTVNECYQLNREHSFPNSWFGGEATEKEPKYNDLFHMYPVSGRVNSIRNDNPYGKVQEGKATFTSSNGSMFGPSATPGFEGKVFEPIDEYKGDLARTYFYMVTRYEDEVADWDTVYNKGGEKACVVCNGTSTQALQDWVVALLLEWHRLDPVSRKERDRNDSIYTIQHNRNPFIDFPELVEKIWGNDMFAFGVASTPSASVSTSREPAGYYEAAYGKSGFALKSALSNIIDNHTVISYDGLWEAFKSTDARSNGKVWDMYSDCDFTFGTDKCGNYKNECDCYNREHSFPKSWFNDGKPMYSDLFHLYPTDGKVNGMRSNYPFGEVSSPTYTSKNGSKLGKNGTSGYSGTVFEPVDEYKGDFARSYFYMVTRYENQVGGWSCDMLESGNKTRAFKQWAVDLLLKWHRQDPVSDKEIQRNDAVYAQQHNRNPFIDYPEMVEKIWGSDNTAFNGAEPQQVSYTLPYAYRNAEGSVVFADTLKVYSSKGQAKAKSLSIVYPENNATIYTDAVAGQVRLGGLEPEEINNTYHLKMVNLPYDMKYTLEATLLKNGEAVASASSSFQTCDTTSVTPGHEVDPDKEYYMIPYVYKNGEGTVLRRDTLYMEVAGQEDTTEPVDYTGLTVVYPKQAEELLETALVARASLDTDEDEEGTRHAEYFRLPEIDLEHGGVYLLEIELWRAGRCMDKERVGFSVRPIDPDPVADETAEKIGFKVYPNPNRGDFCVDVPEGSRVEVFSARGVLLQRLENVGGLRNLHVQAPGLYVVRVSVDGRTAVKRVVVE